MRVVFLAPLLLSTVFCPRQGGGVHLFYIFLSRYFSVSFEYNFFSFNYKKKKRKERKSINKL